MQDTAYDSSRILCRRCLEKEINAKELRAYLDNYVRELPDGIRTDAQTYAHRLTHCESCTRRVGFTCTMCGCYIQSRAAKRTQRCPQRCW